MRPSLAVYKKVTLDVYKHVFDGVCVHSKLWIRLYGTIYIQLRDRADNGIEPI